MNPAVLILRGVIKFYQWFVSPVLGHGCRFAPSCSEYALDAVSSHGAIRGSRLALVRILRCHPWGGSGYDPVPTPAPEPGRERPRRGHHAQLPRRLSTGAAGGKTL